MQNKPKINFSYDDGLQVSLGERKYNDQMAALNESIRNSIDNKSTSIKVFISNERITIDDDGTGMDENTFNNDYFRIGKLNVNPDKGGLFGIGALAHRALAHKTELISHVQGHNRSIRVVVDWDKKEIIDTEWIASTKEQHGTSIILTNLKYQPGDPLDVRKYLERKYFPIFVNPKPNLIITVNDKECRVKEPNYEDKYEFDSTKDFVLEKKIVPAVPNIEFGRVYGTIYIVAEPDKDNTTYVYDRLGTQLDIYSQKDWLHIGSLTSAAAFRTRLLAIINTSTEEYVDANVPKNNILQIKSNREGFFEGLLSFKKLVEYLNGKPNGENLKLPNGGILRLIHARWMEEYEKGKPDKFIKSSDEATKNIIPVIKELLKDEETVWKTKSDGKEEKEKPRKKEDEKNQAEPRPKAEHKRLQCPQCKAFNYITVNQYKIYVDNPNPEAKQKMRKNWPCKTCGYYLNPDTDLHKIKSSPKKAGTIITKVEIGKGTWVDIQHQGLGESGELADCHISAESLVINEEHAFYVQAYKLDQTYKLGTKMLEQHMIMSALYAYAQAKKRELGMDFEKEFNKMCANAHRLVKTELKQKQSKL